MRPAQGAYMRRRRDTERAKVRETGEVPMHKNGNVPLLPWGRVPGYRVTELGEGVLRLDPLP